MKAMKAKRAKRVIKVGDIVTCKRPEEAYYSRYAGNPICCLRPRDLGAEFQTLLPLNPDEPLPPIKVFSY